MADKLVTLAIRTYQRAQMIKAVLEENGIETIIHNLNLENPEMAVGVRVRIKESDLPRALSIVEKMESEWENGIEKKDKQQILLPIDFSDHSTNSIDFAFDFAKKHNAEITLLYVYYSPAFTILSNKDRITYSISDSEMLRRIITSANADVENMTNLLNKRIRDGELPKIPFSFELKEGIPEEQILDYCKKNNPVLVVMGTRGKKISKNNELIGSVTAEVIDSCPVPVLALPIETHLQKPDDIQRVAFLTNFDQKDLIAIDNLIGILGKENLQIHFIHAAEKNEVWNEVMLSGIKSYFSNHYPQLTTCYEILTGDLSNTRILNDYLVKKKVDILAFNARRRSLFARLFNPGLAYRMVIHSDTPLFISHV